MNLVLNASESLEGRPGTVSVRVSRARVDASRPCQCVEGSHCADGEYACVEVRDDGSGMTPETRRHAFEPFFSTRFAGRGLGLSTVLGTVRAHGGGIEVTSAPGQGPTVDVYLPLSARIKVQLGERVVGGESILAELL